jgi:hypothetical protein
MKLQPQGLLPNFEEMLERFIFNIIDEHSFALFLVLSFILGVGTLIILNSINNIFAIIRINFEELYNRRR